MTRTKYHENEPPRDQDPAQNAAPRERFGIPDPCTIMTEVDRIVKEKLPDADSS